MSKAEEQKFDIKFVINKENTKMSKAEEQRFNIKVVINKENTKVLFAEAGSAFTDILLSFLLLPLGRIVEVMKKHYRNEEPVIGSLNTLYNGVANLDSIHFDTEDDKNMLLNPRSHYEKESDLSELRLNFHDTQLTISDLGNSYDGVFTKSAASYIICDDLRVMPNVGSSIMDTLRNLGIDVADMDGIKTRNVTFGLNEIMILLKGSLVSRNPLSALVLHASQMKLATVKFEHRDTFLQKFVQKAISNNPKKMLLKVLLQKSSNKLLFAQADHEFINFLFGLLILPLARVEYYFSSNAGLKSMDNLHECINCEKNMHISMHLKGAGFWLTIPWVADSWSPNVFFPLNFDPEFKNCHVKESRMYMVSDDLTVTPLGLTSTLSVLDGLKISLSDVKELELQVGLIEGLSILKAALTSTTALTDGLKPWLRNSLGASRAAVGVWQNVVGT